MIIFTSNFLKLIAIICMTIDHAGAILYPASSWMRIVGRITFPIMAYMAAQGYMKTKNLNNYLRRLFIFALITAVPFFLAFKTFFNVMFTIAVALVAINISDKKETKAAQILTFFLISLLAIFCDWSIFGTTMIYIFYRNKCNVIKSVPWLMLMAVITYTLFGVFDFFYRTNLFNNYLFELGIFLAIPILMLYNGKQGIKNKFTQYAFYVYYPLHLLVLWLIKVL